MYKERWKQKITWRTPEARIDAKTAKRKTKI